MITENKELDNMNAIYHHSWGSGYNLPLMIDIYIVHFSLLQNSRVYYILITNI